MSVLACNLRAVHGKQDFGSEEYTKARNNILNAMAADVAVQLGNDLPDTPETPANHDETQLLHPHSRRPYEYGYTAARAAYPDESHALPAMADMYDEDFAAAAPEPEITPPRRPPIKFSLRTIGMLSIMVCAAAVIAGAGTLLFSRNNDESSLAWFAGEPRVVISQPPREEPSPEVLAELAKLARALPTAETASRGPSVEVQAVASRSPIQQLSPEELAELVKLGNGLIEAGTASILPSLAASQAVVSGSPSLAAALAWYQNSR
jgi:hypothetical protein